MTDRKITKIKIRKIKTENIKCIQNINSENISIVSYSNILIIVIGICISI